MMDRREDIRTGLRAIMWKVAGQGMQWSGNMEHIMTFLHVNGVVIKDNRDPTDCESCPVAVLCGYVAVEPLIEGTNFEDFKEELLKNPKIHEAYDKLQPEYDSIIRGLEDAMAGRVLRVNLK